MHEERYVVSIIVVVIEARKLIGFDCLYVRNENTALTFVRTIEVFDNISIFVCSNVVDLDIIIEISVAVQLLVVRICQESLHCEKYRKKDFLRTRSEENPRTPKPEFQLYSNTFTSGVVLPLVISLRACNTVRDKQTPMRNGTSSSKVQYSAVQYSRVSCRSVNNLQSVQLSPLCSDMSGSSIVREDSFEPGSRWDLK